MSKLTAAFNRSRPIYHVLPPNSWVNDPCGFTFIPETGEYLLFLQWAPRESETCWGVVRSKDLLHWIDSYPAIFNGSQGSTWDTLGVFTGSVTSSLDSEGNRVLRLYYTSVNHLPIHWSEPYLPGCETQSVVTSRDYGYTWKKHVPPLIRSPPFAERTTGWRDPYVATWPSVSHLCGHADVGTREYMLVASGCKNVGPKLLLYEAQPEIAYDQSGSWRYLGELVGFDKHHKLQDWLPDIGVNFECASFATLVSNGEPWEVLFFGAENVSSLYGSFYSNRCTFWLLGKLVNDSNGKPTFQVYNSGLLDDGMFYAPAIGRGPKDNLIMWGWIDEAHQGHPIDSRDPMQQGWAGTLALPRELFILQFRGKMDSQSPSLGIRPGEPLSALENHATLYDNVADWGKVRSTSFKVEAKLSGPQDLGIVEFLVRASPDLEEYTSIFIDWERQVYGVRRDHSSRLEYVIKSNHEGRLLPGPIDGLSIIIYVDNSIVEVFVNNVSALTTRIYPTRNDANRVHFFVNGQDIVVRPNQISHFSVQLWSDIPSVWGERKDFGSMCRYPK